MRVYDRLGQRRTRDVASRLVDHSDRSGECWLWLGSLSLDGYGRISVRGVDRMAHVVSYERSVGPVPNGLQLDHLCRNRACINPAHLEPVTGQVNCLRGAGSNGLGKCRKGHDVPGGGRCKVCRNAAQRAWYERKRDALSLTATEARRG